MNPRYLQDLIRNLQEFYKCPSCDTNYHFDDIKFLGEVENYCFVQLGCHKCSMPVLATVTIDGRPRPTKAENALEDGTGEALRFAAKGEITAGEIAEFHRWVTKSRLFFKSSK